MSTEGKDGVQLIKMHTEGTKFRADVFRLELLYYVKTTP